MARPRVRRLVIDASVLRSAGREASVHPTGQYCRDILHAVRAASHHVVVTPAIRAEWDRHAGSYARSWRVSMVARKRLLAMDDVADDALRAAIVATLPDGHARTAALKDCHLVEAAQRTDRALLSRDEEARGLFAQVAQGHRPLHRLLWVNPERPEEDAMAWVVGGAASERNRWLG